MKINMMREVLLRLPSAAAGGAPLEVATLRAQVCLCVSRATWVSPQPQLCETAVSAFFI